MLSLMVSLFTTAQTIEKTYYLGQPSISQIQGYEQIQFTDCMQSALAGQPSLPWQSVSLMLPQGTEAASIEVELSDFHPLPDGPHLLQPRAQGVCKRRGPLCLEERLSCPSLR